MTADQAVDPKAPLQYKLYIVIFLFYAGAATACIAIAMSTPRDAAGLVLHTPKPVSLTAYFWDTQCCYYPSPAQLTITGLGSSSLCPVIL